MALLADAQPVLARPQAGLSHDGAVRETPAGLSRRDRIQAAGRLDELATEIDKIGAWLDRYGGDADKGSVLAECGARDLRAAAWVLRLADHELPENWLAPQGRFRAL